jgi:hypothetical protein
MTTSNKKEHYKNAEKVILSLDENYNPIELKTFCSRTNSSVHVTAKGGNAVIYF